MSEDITRQKARLRRRAYDARNAQENKDEVSRTIIEKFLAQPEYTRAGTVMWYLDVRSEVRTRLAIGEALGSGRRIVVPYCTRDDEGRNALGLWHLESVSELVPGTWNILEPPRRRWGETGKEVSPAELDLVMVPGVGFDRRGARLGNGQGYYDRLLGQVRPGTTLMAPAFECQIFDEIVAGPHDVFMHKVITEFDLYICQAS